MSLGNPNRLVSAVQVLALGMQDPRHPTLHCLPGLLRVSVLAIQIYLLGPTVLHTFSFDLFTYCTGMTVLFACVPGTHVYLSAP